jgi:succinoglycan biosynthesis transport protein ExoP
MTMDESVQPSTDYLRFARRVAQHWKLIASMFVALGVPVIIWALVFAPKTYTARATVFIEDRRAGSGGLLRDLLTSNDGELQLAVLRSRSLAEGVLENLPRESMTELIERSIGHDYLMDMQNRVRRLLGGAVVVASPRERALSELQRSRVEFETRRTGEVVIQATAFTPRVAMDLTNTYVDVLQARSRSVVREEARSTREFLESYLNQTKVVLQEAEEALAKATGGRVIGRFPEQANAQLAQLAASENTLADIQASKEIAKSRLSFLRGGKGLPGVAGMSVGATVLDQMRQRLGELEQKVSTLREKYTDEHPLVVATLNEIKEVQRNLASALQPVQEPKPSTPVKLGQAERAALSRQMADLEVEVSSLDAKEAVLKRRIATFQTSMSGLSAQQLESSRLMRTVETQRNLYSLLSERLGAVRIQEEAGGRTLRVIDLASLPTSPTNSPLKKIVLAGLVASLGLGIGLATAIEYLNQPIETGDEAARATGLPLLGWLPAIGNAREPKLTWREPVNLFEAPGSLSLSAEGCRSIRTALESISREQPLRSLMIASAGPREGKSTILLNLARAFCESGRRVVLVDSDLRRPTLHRVIGAHAERGLVDLLRGGLAWEDVRQEIQENLVFVPAGPVKAARAGALLNAEQSGVLLGVTTSHGDRVLFDSAPVLAVSDNLILASMVDAVILVARAGHTQRRELVEAKDKLERVGAKVVGIVLNGLPPRDTRHYYSRYGAYYSSDVRFAPTKGPRWLPAWWRSRQSTGRRKGVVR